MLNHIQEHRNKIVCKGKCNYFNDREQMLPEPKLQRQREHIESVVSSCFPKIGQLPKNNQISK